MKKASLFAIAIVLLAVSAKAQQTAPGAVSMKKDIVYGRAGGIDLLLNLAKPETESPLPALLYVHGGGWQLGNKDESDPLVLLFASYGYAVASVGYRLTPDHKWPAQIEDVKCAVRYLRANAEELGIDPQRIGAVGESAGGHLVLMLGLMDGNGPLDQAGGNAGPSSKVNAVVNLFGVTEFASWSPPPLGMANIEGGFKKSLDALMTDMFGTADRSSAVMKQASPVSHIDAGDPPVLTIHGEIDPIVPVNQAQILHEALKKAGVDTTLVVVEKVEHGWQGEKQIESLRLVREFFDKHFKQQPAQAKP